MSSYGEAAGARPAASQLRSKFVDQYPFEPNEELAGDTGAAFAGADVGMAISVAKARAAINIFMTHLLLHCTGA